MATIVLLNLEQLRKLAKVVYLQEAQAITSIKFRSEPELAKYLVECKATYESLLNLLKTGDEVERQFQNDPTRAGIAKDINSYIQISVNNAIQNVPNYLVRLQFLSKIVDHSKTLVNSVQTLVPNNVINVANEVAQYKNAMLKYTSKYKSIASRAFSRWVNDNGWTFQDLVQRFQTKLNFAGPFKDLQDAQKIQVYEKIIEASGRGKVIANKIFGGFGLAVLLFAAGMMVWDIFSTEHILQEATKTALSTIAAVGGAMLGEVVGVAVSTLVGIKATSMFVVLAGLLTSIAGAFILGAFVGWLVDLIFHSGGTTFSTDGHHCYVAQMPNTKVLAFQIQHQEINKP